MAKVKIKYPDIKFPELTEWVTATDAAKELNIARQSMNKLIRLGRFRTTHVMGSARQYVVKRSELDQIKEQRRQASESSDPQNRVFH